MRKVSMCAVVCVLLSIFLLSGCMDSRGVQSSAEDIVIQSETIQDGTIIQQIMRDTKTGYTYLYTYTYDRVGMEEVCCGVSVTIIDDDGIIRETITNSYRK